MKAIEKRRKRKAKIEEWLVLGAASGTQSVFVKEERE